MNIQTWTKNDVRDLIQTYLDERGGLLPALHALQRQYGFIDKALIPFVAELFNLTRAEVYGVVSFYHDFRLTAPGRHVVRICQAEACQATGSRALSEHARKILKTDFHENSSDGEFTLKPVFCLGNCASSPSVMVDDKLFGRVDETRLDQIIKDYRVEADN